MPQTKAYYNGQYISCYPGSNQRDEGKLQTEFNMARLVTRVSSKNFCTVKPSFELSLANPTTILVSKGEASINGMDLIMTESITVAAPESAGTYYLGMKLARNDQGNVLGDLTVGVDQTFEGVYITYFNEKDEDDKDVLWLGKLKFDGTTISDIEEDDDKYGRIWAEDILAKIMDPKHPDQTRIILQELIYNLPDWYMSKLGDEMKGPLILVDKDGNPGVLIKADENGSQVVIKNPNSADKSSLLLYGDVNNDGVIDAADITIIEKIINGTQTPTAIQQVLGDVNHDGKIDEKDLEYISNFIAQNKQPYGETGNIYFIERRDDLIYITDNDTESDIQIDKSHIIVDKATDDITLSNPSNIIIDSDKKVTIKGDEEVEISSNESPKVLIKNHTFNIIDDKNTDLPFNVKWLNNTQVEQTLGKAIWRYDETTKTVSLLDTNTDKLYITPATDFAKNVSILNGSTLQLKKASTDDTIIADYSHIKLRNADNSIYTDINKQSILSKGNNNYIKITNADDSSNIVIKPQSLNIYNNVGNGVINFNEQTSDYSASIYKTLNSTQLNISGLFHVVGATIIDSTLTAKGLYSSNGILTLKNGTNDATITKVKDSTTIVTNGNIKVGTSGTASITAGQSAFASLGIGGTTYSNSECKIDASGNINTSGNITATKVYRSLL